MLLVEECNIVKIVVIGFFIVVFVIVVLIVIGLVGGNYWVCVFDFVMLYVMFVLGLNVVVGFVGLFDLGYIVFYVVGVYMVVLLSLLYLIL